MLKVRPQSDDGLKDVPAKTMSAFAQPASATSLMSGLLRIYLPNYTPHDVEISAGVQTLADKYTKFASEFNT